MLFSHVVIALLQGPCYDVATQPQGTTLLHKQPGLSYSAVFRPFGALDDKGVMDEPTSQPKRRLRFSLLNLLLITAIVALTLTVIKLWQDVGPLQREIKGLRDELGYLSVTDKNLPHAVQLNTGNKFHWKWRVWIPEGKDYLASCGLLSNMKDEYQSNNSAVSLGEGESTIEYLIVRNPEDNKWYGTLSCNGTGVGGGFAHEWVDWNSVRIESSKVDNSTYFSNDKPFDLMRYRMYRQVDSFLPGEKQEESGFVIWLEPL